MAAGGRHIIELIPEKQHEFHRGGTLRSECDRRCAWAHKRGSCLQVYVASAYACFDPSADTDKVPPMQRIVVLNPKGGSGKTTLAINLASYFATRQQTPVLMDFDPQGSSLRWVKKRQANQPLVQ